ncbi:MAG: NUDIX domain-containing protein [Planctomycetota bacterium]|nr:MAG: NUDIX domain-containing protein [Planctomycetota bacterium]
MSKAQAGAVPYRDGPFGHEVLLVTTRGKGGWGIPKGGVKKGHSLEQTARLETLEEAGVLGPLDPVPLGSYVHPKKGSRREVVVYALRVERVLDRWAEDAERHRVWVPLAEAGTLVERKELQRLFTRLRHRLLAASLSLTRRAA